MATTPAARRAALTLWGSRAGFASGLAVSLWANIWASSGHHGPIGIASGVWSPLALLITLLIAENMSAKTWGGRARLAGMILIAGIAAWVSYWHLVDFFQAGGIDDPGAHLMPFTVDVLMALAGPSMKRKAAPARTTRRPAAKKNVTPITKARKASA